MKQSLSELRFYVYILLDPRKGVLTPFYVGKGTGPRVTNHFNPSSMRKCRNVLKNSVIQKIRDAGLKPSYYIIEGLTEREAFDKEIALIARFGRRNLGTGILTNLTNGGEGASGVVMSDELREQRRRQMSGAGSPTFGIGHTEAAKLKMSNSQKQRIVREGPRLHTDEWKQKLREINPGGASRRRAVRKIDNKGNTIATFESVAATAKLEGISCAHINKLVKAEGYSFRGYIYRHHDYEITPEELEKSFSPRFHAKHIGVEKRSSDGELLAKYRNIKEASSENRDIHYQAIWKAVNRGTMAGGFYWCRVSPRLP